MLSEVSVINSGQQNQTRTCISNYSPESWVLSPCSSKDELYIEAGVWDFATVRIL